MSALPNIRDFMDAVTIKDRSLHVSVTRYHLVSWPYLAAGALIGFWAYKKWG